MHQPKQLQLQQKQIPNPPKGGGNWRKKLLIVFILAGTMTSVWIFWHFNERINFRREGTLSNMCDERARMLQDQFNVSLNHVHALALLVSTFHHGKSPSAMNQVKFHHLFTLYLLKLFFFLSRKSRRIILINPANFATF